MTARRGSGMSDAEQFRAWLCSWRAVILEVIRSVMLSKYRKNPINQISEEVFPIFMCALTFEAP